MHELLLMLVGAQEDKNLSTPNARVRSPPPPDRQKAREVLWRVWKLARGLLDLNSTLAIRLAT